MARSALRVALGLDGRRDDEEAADDGRGLVVTPAAALKPQKMAWLWEGRLRFSTVAFLQGSKGAGKSTWLRALAADVTGGPRITAAKAKRRTLGSVLWFAGEEDLEVRVVPGLKAAGADMRRVYCADLYGDEEANHLQLPEDRDRLEALVAERKACLVVLDPVFAFCSPSCPIEGTSYDARRFMRSCSRVAKRTGALIILARNLTKNTSSGALASGRGNGELGNAARSVLHCEPLADHPGLFGMAVAGGNDGPPAPTITYTLEPHGRQGAVRVVVQGTTELSADELSDEGHDDGGNAECDVAKRFLRQLLADGWVDSKDVLAEAANAMVSPRTLWRAKAALAIVSRRAKGKPARHQWGPPRGGFPPLK